MVWVRADRPTYHLLRACQQLAATAGTSAPEQATMWMKEAEARRRGLTRCYLCYGSRGRTA
jgi:hypothetical protein